MSKVDMSFNNDEFEHYELWLLIAMLMKRLGNKATFTQDEVFDVTDTPFDFSMEFAENGDTILKITEKTEG